MNTIVEQLRNAWSSLLKWTASIAIFFITASLAFLVFQVDELQYDLGFLNVLFLTFTLLLSLITIFITWGLLSLNVFRILKTLANTPHISEDDLKKYRKAVDISKPLEWFMHICFVLDIISFTAFLLSFINWRRVFGL
jgi:hypothetical protein